MEAIIGRPGLHGITPGNGWSQRELYPAAVHREPQARQVLKALRCFFNVGSLARVSSIMCWVDTLKDQGYPSHYMTLEKAWIMGVFYTQVTPTMEIPTHFFVRRVENMRMSLDKWVEDMSLPEGTSSFSACYIFPDGYQLPNRALTDPNNVGIVCYNVGFLESKGVSLNEILAYIEEGD